jgi:hypothetical protein
MWVLITDLVTGTCDITAKKNAECLRVRLDQQSPEFCCVPAELIKVLRLRKKQDSSGTSAGRREA